MPSLIKLVSKPCLKTGLLLLLLMLAAATFSWTAAEESAEKATNQAPQRLVSLSPHLTENLFSLGAGRLLVGAAEPLDYPAEAKKLPSLGRFDQLNPEEILALQPTLVVAWQAGNQRLLARLEQLGLQVFTSQPQRLEDIATELVQLGELTGLTAQAERLAADYLANLKQLQDAYANKPSKKVFYQLGGRPMFTLNNQHFISQALQICGGENVFGELNTLAPQINAEEVLLANPEVIFIAASPAQAKAELAYWQKFPSLTAVKTNQIHLVNPDLLQRPTLRVLAGIEEICALL